MSSSTMAELICVNRHSRRLIWLTADWRVGELDLHNISASFLKKPHGGARPISPKDEAHYLRDARRTSVRRNCASDDVDDRTRSDRVEARVPRLSGAARAVTRKRAAAQSHHQADVNDAATMGIATPLNGGSGPPVHSGSNRDRRHDRSINPRTRCGVERGRTEGLRTMTKPLRRTNYVRGALAKIAEAGAVAPFECRH
jgi:hypothetical protein